MERTNMKILLAESAGFCYGVRRALDTVLATSRNGNARMYTLGPLIHNPQVIKALESEGIITVKSLDEVPEGSTVIMPSHGVPRQVMEQAKASGLAIVDVTCPFVSKVQRIAERLVKDGYEVIVLGDKGHTEVRGILSVAGDDAVAVTGVEELRDVSLKKRVGIVAQTTQTVERFQELVSYVSGHAYEVRAYNTICNATLERQKAALDLTSKVDVMLVVGGRNSANTRRLAEICAETGTPTHHIEIADEIEDDWFASVNTVGISAGASTPDWIIEAVIDRVRKINIH